MRHKLHDHLEKQKQQKIAAKESIKRIRHAFATQRVAPMSGRATASSAATSRSAAASLGTSAAVEKLPMLQVAKIYETLLQSAENEARVARAEAALLRQSLKSQRAQHGDVDNNTRSSRKRCCCDSTTLNAAREVAEAQEVAERAREEVQVLQEELSQRPLAAEHARLQRQTEILTNRLARLEKEKTLLFSPGKSSSRAMYSSNASLSSGGARAQQAQQQQPSHLPKHVALELIDTLASVYHCRDPLQLPEAAREAQKNASSVNSLRRLVDEICDVVFKQGDQVNLNLIPWTLREEDPSNIPAILISWVERMDEAESMQSTMHAVRRQLSRRPPGSQHAHHGDGRGQQQWCGADVLATVAHLVDLELRLLGKEDATVVCEACRIDNGTEEANLNDLRAEIASLKRNETQKQLPAHGHSYHRSPPSQPQVSRGHAAQNTQKQKKLASSLGGNREIQVSKIPAGKKFPEIEIFAPAGLPAQTTGRRRAIDNSSPGSMPRRS